MTTLELVERKRRRVVRRVGSLLERIVESGKRRIAPAGYTLHRGSVLPPRDARMGGVPYQDDEFFLNSAIGEARRVATLVEGRADQFLVDIGCGEGRLPIGLIHESQRISYVGLDVKRTAIEWCREYIQRDHPDFHFEHVDVVNARDNPGGVAIASDYRLPVQSARADIVYLWGVLTNMEPEHLAHYAGEIARLLRRGGTAFLTAHVEEGVPDATINPEGYTPYACSGPLHAVRYDREYLLGTFRRAGLVLTELAYHMAGNCQSDLYFVKH